MNKHEAWQLTREAAELYERYVARYILAPWAPLLVDGARLAEGERVLDVACGTGVVTRAAAKREMAGSAAAPAVMRRNRRRLLQQTEFRIFCMLAP